MSLIWWNENGTLFLCVYFLFLKIPIGFYFKLIGDKRAQRYTWCLCIFICTVPFAWISFLGIQKYYTNNKDLLNSTGNSTQYSTTIICRKIQKRPDTCICTTEPPHCTSETNTINLQTNYTSIQNKNQIKMNYYIFSTLPGQGSLSHAPVPQIGVIFSFFLIWVLPDILNQCLFNEKVKESSLQTTTKHYLSGFFFFFIPKPTLWCNHKKNIR